MTTVRTATETDVSAICALCTELGYPTDEDAVCRRYLAIAGDASHAVFVAEDEAAGVIGWVHVMPRVLLESDPAAEIGGLVVSLRARREGVGRALVARAETWARENRYDEIVVRSNAKRLESHRFYPQAGYELVKEQKVYRKSLRGGS